MSNMGVRIMAFIRWVQRGCRFQLYKDFYGRLKIKPMGGLCISSMDNLW